MYLEVGWTGQLALAHEDVLYHLYSNKSATKQKMPFTNGPDYLTLRVQKITFMCTRQLSIYSCQRYLKDVQNIIREIVGLFPGK
jgi:hypothetical protein